MNGYSWKSLCSKKGWVTLRANFRGNGTSLTNDRIGVIKLESLGYHVVLLA